MAPKEFPPMADEHESQNHRPEVWAIGSLPPPITGMSLLTEKVVLRLAERTPLTIANFSSGDAQPRPHTRALRILRTLGCLAKLVIHGRVRDARLYLTCNSRGGLQMTSLLIRAARRLGYSIYLHHHVYMYIDEYDATMASISRHLGARDVHLMHCPKMIDDFRALYPTPAQFAFLYPSIASLPLCPPRQQLSQPLRLGFLANLAIAKGLDLVLETFRALIERKHDVRLCLAGLFNTKEAERLVKKAVGEHAGVISYVGAVYDERKVEFFNSIDCFLFPSRTEGWPIVLNEALASGVPVIATNRGCIRTCVGERAGLVVDDARQYVDSAIRQIECWIDSPSAYCAASQAAVDQADQCQREAALQLEQLISRICSPSEVT
jgi:glycosyltransferase involved in cell wall biosynthesis